MERVDYLIIAVLAVGVLASVVGLSLYDPEGTVSDFTVQWRVDETALQTVQGPSVNGPGAAAAEITIGTPNLTHVELVVTASAGGVRAQSMTVDVEVRPPGMDPLRASGTIPAGGAASIEILLEVPIQEVPTRSEVRGAGAEEARSFLDAEYGNDEGTGAWGIEVTYGSAAPLAPLDNYERSFTVDMALHHYRAELQPSTPDVVR